MQSIWSLLAFVLVQNEKSEGDSTEIFSVCCPQIFFYMQKISSRKLSTFPLLKILEGEFYAKGCLTRPWSVAHCLRVIYCQNWITKLSKCERHFAKKLSSFFTSPRIVRFQIFDGILLIMDCFWRYCLIFPQIYEKPSEIFYGPFEIQFKSRCGELKRFQKLCIFFLKKGRLKTLECAKKSKRCFCRHNSRLIPKK